MSKSSCKVTGTIGFTGNTTEVYVAGKPISGIHGIHVDAKAGEVTKVALTLVTASMPFSGEGKFYLSHPLKGQMKAVKRVEFEDGTVWDVADMEVTEP